MSERMKWVTLAPPGGHEVDGIPAQPPVIVPVELDDQQDPDPIPLIRQMREALAAAMPLLLTAEEHPSLTARINKAETALAAADEFLKA